MVSMRKQYEASFKAKIALEAIRGEKTMAELASEFDFFHNSRTSLGEAVGKLNSPLGYAPLAPEAFAVEKFNLGVLY